MIQIHKFFIIKELFLEFKNSTSYSFLVVLHKQRMQS